MLYVNMKNKWIIDHIPASDRQQAGVLAQDINQSHVIGELLAARGVHTFEEARQFFRPDLKMLHDPMLMKDMDKALDRLTKAIVNKEKIMIYGDYDVDGITAVALVYLMLIKIHPQSELNYYIPNRETEGYGVSIQGIETAAKWGAKLLITLDCGIKAVDMVNEAKMRGIDVIICDHHQVGDTLPAAVAVLDPKRGDCHYPYDELSGCGVGFKLMQAFANANPGHLPLFEHLDLLALSIAADIVPITGENRILAFHGMRQINRKPSEGIKGLLQVCGLADEDGKANKEISITDIVFKVGPRLNASGRLHDAKEAVRLLINHNEEQITQKSQLIEEYNSERKKLDNTMTEEAKQLVMEDPQFDKKCAIVLYNPSWVKGVVGIVASRMCEIFYKPAIVLTRTQRHDVPSQEQSEFIVSGSARSVGGFDLYAAIDSCSDLLLNWGGHTYAAGISLKEENLEEFRHRFEKYVAEHITEEQKHPVIHIDAELTFADIMNHNNKFWNTLKQFEPFGPGNTKPVFVTRGVKGLTMRTSDGTEVHLCKLVGAEKKHLKLTVTDGTCYSVKNGQEEKTVQTQINGIAFNMSDFYPTIIQGQPIDICYQLEENHFREKKSLQLTVRDIKQTGES